MDNPDDLNCTELAKVAFENMDFNKDNKITKEEFVRAAMGSDKIVGVLAYKVLDLVTTDCA